MRKLLQLPIAVALGLCLAGGASAEMLRWEGTLVLHVVRTDAFILPATGGGFATVNASAGLGHLTTLAVDGGITGAGNLWVTDTNVAPIVSVRVVKMSLGSGVLRPISGAAASGGGLTQDVLPLNGDIRFCLIFGACVSFIAVPLTVGGTRGMGIGGILTVDGYGPGLHVSLHGAPWTIGVASVTGIPTENGGFASSSVSGFVHAPGSSTSSTARIGGVVRLVTPAKIVSTLGGETVWPMFGILTIQFVPEPSTALLLGAGIAGLVLVGRVVRRRRKPSRT